MTQSMNPQIIAALADATRLNEGEGFLLALHPDFILVVRSGMNEDERETAADALLSAAEGLSLPVLEDPVDDEDSGASAGEDGLYIAPGMLDTAKIFDLDNLTYIVEKGRIIIETEDQ